MATVTLGHSPYDFPMAQPCAIIARVRTRRPEESSHAQVADLCTGSSVGNLLGGGGNGGALSHLCRSPPDGLALTHDRAFDRVRHYRPGSTSSSRISGRAA